MLKWEVQTQRSCIKEKIFILLGISRMWFAPFRGFWGKGKLIGDANVWSIHVKIAWVHMWGNVGLWENIRLANVKWNHDNLKRGGLKVFDLPYLQFLPYFLVNLDQLIVIKSQFDIVVVVVGE